MSTNCSTDYRAVITSAGRNPSLSRKIFAFRKRLFIDIAKWDLPSNGRYEYDQFDHSGAKYAAIFRDTQLVGTFRAIRTDQRYLAAEIFPELSQNIRYPKDANAWEISRFGVLPLENSRARFEAAKVNYAMMLRFAKMYGASRLVAVADLQYERFLRTIGIHTRRLGLPQVVGRTKEGKLLELVAGEIPIHEQSGPKFENLLKTSKSLEVNDETAIFGHEALSA